MSQLPVTLACGLYDRTRTLADGRVTIGGADLRYVPFDSEEIFFRILVRAHQRIRQPGSDPGGRRRPAPRQRGVRPEELFAPETGDEFVI